jgi:lysophospholipid acyltransferase (LPLAT)-like uncharacterized protein
LNQPDDYAKGGGVVLSIHKQLDGSFLASVPESLGVGAVKAPTESAAIHAMRNKLDAAIQTKHVKGG